MAGPSRRHDNLPDSMYSVMDFEALAAIETEYQETEDRTRSPTSSGAGSRPASRARGHQTRQQKRREQNKAAQRSFRARKEQHLSELIARIDSLELRKKVIEEENQQLMHELLRKRAENNLLRSRRPSRASDTWPRPLTARASLSGLSTSARNPIGRSNSSSDNIPGSGGGGGGGGGGVGGGGGGAGAGGGGSGSGSTVDNESGPTSSNFPRSRAAIAAGKRPLRDFPGAAEQYSTRRVRTLPVETLMWLYGPFLDVWNLIREQPAVVRGDVEMGDVVDRLKEMARYEDNAAAARAAANKAKDDDEDDDDDDAARRMSLGSGAGAGMQTSLLSSSSAAVANLLPIRARARSL